MAAPFRIIAIGDSLTYGYPFGKVLSWVELTSRELQVPILNQGINGNNLKDLLRRLPIDVLDLNPEYCIITGGTNDVYQGVSVKLMESNFSKLIELLKVNKIRPVAGLPAPVQDGVYEKELAKFRRWLKKIAKEKSLPTIDFYSAFIDPKMKKIIPSYLEDGVHPTSKGYEAMSKAAVKTLKNLL
jgi:lysophospholipase L1-like esterase